MNVDFYNRTYTAEVLRTKRDAEGSVRAISRLTLGPRQDESYEGLDSAPIKINHCFLASRRPHHRVTRHVELPDGDVLEVPRRKTVRNREHYLYDVILASRRTHLVVAVPFHGLAEQFFLRVDRALAGTGTVYERLDITRMVVELGPTGVMEFEESADDGSVKIGLTRCQLAYSDPERRSRDIQQLRMTGANLGASKVYRSLIRPVLEPKNSALTVTPVVLGFGLSENGIRKSSATTDRHGNFKVWISPGLRQVVKLFKLLDTIEEMNNVVSTTSNVPILQSRTIKDTEGG